MKYCGAAERSKHDSGGRGGHWSCSPGYKAPPFRAVPGAGDHPTQPSRVPTCCLCARPHSTLLTLKLILHLCRNPTQETPYGHLAKQAPIRRHQCEAIRRPYLLAGQARCRWACPFGWGRKVTADSIGKQSEAAAQQARLPLVASKEPRANKPLGSVAGPTEPHAGWGRVQGLEARVLSTGCRW